MDSPNPDCENLESKAKIEIDSSQLCFICLNDRHSSESDSDVALRNKCDRGHLKREEKERDKKKCGVKILTSYILQHSFPSSKENQDRDELHSSILSSFSEENLSICSECLSKAKNLVELHLELEKIRMQILDVLKSLQDYLKSSLRSHEVGIQDDAVISRFQTILLQEFMYCDFSSELHLQVRLTSSDTTTTKTIGNYGSTSFCNAPSNGNDLDSVSVDPLETCNIDIEVKEDHDSDADDNDAEYKPEVDFVDEDEDNDDDEASSSSDPYDDDNTDQNEDKNHLDLVCRENVDLNFVDDNASSSYHDFTQNINEEKGSVEDGRHPTTTKITDKELQTQPILWDCDICLENIPSNDMKSHLKTHPEFEKYYICDLCPSSSSRSQSRSRSSNRVYGTYKGLIWHYLRAYHNMQVPCILCLDEKTLFGREGLCRHLYEIHHPTHKKLQCTEESCSAEFFDPDTRRYHIKREHPGADLYCRNQKVKCPYCLKLMSKKHLRDHIKNIHVLKGKGEWRGTRYLKMKKAMAMASDTIFKCHICDKAFDNEFSRTAHVLRVHPKNLQSCALCPKQFKTKSGLQAHEKTHHEEPGDPVMCTECHKTFSHKHLLRNHVRMVHGARDPLQCQFCPKLFRSKRSLKSHEDLHKKVYKCTEPDCSYSGNTLKNLRSHHRKTHEVKQKTKPFKCSECPFATTESRYLRIHEGIHKEKTIPCKQCDRLFSCEESLKVHERIHRKKLEPDSMQCSTCGKIFKQPRYLEIHIQNVHEKKKPVQVPVSVNRKTYKCPEPGCPYERKSHAALLMHRRVHQDKNLTCQHCSKAFKSEICLENHERSHTQEKSFICQVEGCEEAFISRFLRTLHEKKEHDYPPSRDVEVDGSGSQEKMYVCDLCPSKFKKVESLRLHIKNVHGQPEMVKCPQCGKMVRKEWLRSHIRRVHEKVFRCQHCEKTFTGKIQLNYHEKIHEDDNNGCDNAGCADKGK